jgi:hypothetical protein
MTVADWLMILAVLLGPIIAVRLTRHLDNRKEIRERKLWIFKTLMATRASTLSPHHVEALNRIDLEFSPKNKKEKPVLEAWKAYLDLLGDSGIAQEDPELGHPGFQQCPKPAVRDFLQTSRVRCGRLSNETLDVLVLGRSRRLTPIALPIPLRRFLCDVRFHR